MPDSYSAHGGTDPDTSLSKLFARLETPDSSDSVQAIDTLRDNLQLLDRSHPTLEQQEHVLDKLYARGTTTLEKLIPALVGIPVPAPRKSRQLIRTIQDVLGALSEQLMGLYERCDRTRWPLTHSTPDVVLWRILRILSRHLLIGNLTASQPGNGVWRTLHKTYDLARLHTVTRNVPKEAPRSLQDEYYAAVLLGCAHRPLSPPARSCSSTHILSATPARSTPTVTRPGKTRRCSGSTPPETRRQLRVRETPRRKIPQCDFSPADASLTNLQTRLQRLTPAEARSSSGCPTSPPRLRAEGSCNGFAVDGVIRQSAAFRAGDKITAHTSVSV